MSDTENNTDPSLNPVVDPSLNPVVDPSLNPVVDPSLNPVVDPSLNPVVDPSLNPVVDPSLNPVVDPSLNPVVDPSLNPVVDFTYTFYDASRNPYVVTPVFTWNISKMEVIPAFNGLSNTVKNVYWVYYGNVVINNKNYSSYYSDITALPPPPPLGDSFISYEDLTKEIVEGWLNSLVNLTFVRGFIYNNIQNEFSPPVVSLPLPF